MNSKRRPCRAGVLLAAFSVVACATPPGLEAPAPTALEDPLALHWARTAAEHRAVYEQAFRWIGERVVAQARGRDRGTWAVIMDADETVLDNSEYQLRRARQGLGYTPKSWNAWVRAEAAPALPGAVALVRRIREMGGRVAIVSNRDEEVCDPTRRNLEAVGLDVDVVLCRQRPGGKEGRFRAVAEGGTSAGLPPLEVVAWVGDNIQDFPEGSLELRDAEPESLADFGVRFFILPNPMYGSWERNPPPRSLNARLGGTGWWRREASEVAEQMSGGRTRSRRNLKARSPAPRRSPPLRAALVPSRISPEARPGFPYWDRPSVSATGEVVRACRCHCLA